MKKLTAGIFTVLMGLVSVNAADAAVASKGYVDKVVGENTTKITTLTETANATAQALTDHKSAYDTKVADLEAADTALSNRISTNASAIDELLGTGTGGDGSGSFGQLSTDVSELKTTVGNADSGLVKKVGSLETLVGETAVATQISNALTEKVGTETVATQISAAVNSLKNNEIKENADAIAAINNADTGILAQATEVATTKANTAETNAVAGAKTYTDAKVSGLNLQNIARIPAACSDTKNYCTLTTNGSQFVWEVIARDEETETPEQPSTTAGSDRLIVSPAAIVEPTDAE